MYIMAGAGRLSTASMWSLMGLILRNSEKLGIHRDGTFLGLSPASTEERRRLWWQLQHFDLGLAVMTGVTSLTLMADWDAKLPLNIEDDDLYPDMGEAPRERQGLTSMSYCLYTYWVIQRQRAFFKSIQGRFELSWQSKESLPEVSKEMLIEQLEEGLNTKFLQFCDPIKPVEVLLQLSARSLICMLQLRTLYTLLPNEQMSLERREKLVTASMRSLEYNIASHSHPIIRPFQWWVKGMFPWHSLVCILIEASRQDDPSKVQQLWELLARVYDANTSLYQLSEDRRRLHAAELVLSASKTRQMKPSPNNCPQTPEFVIKLEAQVAGLAGKAAAESTTPSPNIVRDLSTEFPTFENAVPFDLDFQDVDWGFWESIG
ncbi:hypothetical protein LTR84_001250 [Exophiala bonariae]|uniref:Xylanolytic transcriptional activator regulatory domain-containing protein n=1 Tax=Exophiala bonariae TaxID=1690606 RepID=A0AAV9NT64_9EURO|nr:hypothetical protein LTR84_001250 [Exophiala bonariae]